MCDISKLYLSFTTRGKKTDHEHFLFLVLFQGRKFLQLTKASDGSESGSDVRRCGPGSALVLRSRTIPLWLRTSGARASG